MHNKLKYALAFGYTNNNYKTHFDFDLLNEKLYHLKYISIPL